MAPHRRTGHGGPGRLGGVAPQEVGLILARAIRFRTGLAGSLALAASAVLADPIAYSGKVVDQAGNPLPWALLSVAGSNLAAQSGADGTFSLAGEAPAGILPGRPPAGKTPAGPVRPGAAGPEAGGYRADGRFASVPAVTSMLLWAAAIGAGPESAPHAGPAGNAAAPAGKTAAGPWILSVAMARFQSSDFPQIAPTAKGLTLTLAPSATDTAVYAAEKQACLDTLNALRAGAGKPKLAWSKSLEAFADQGVRYDSPAGQAHSHFSAYSKTGTPARAENALPGWPLKYYKTELAVVRAGTKMMWDEGPGGGHYENIIGDYKEVGCGIFLTPQGDVWVIQDFK